MPEGPASASLLPVAGPGRSSRVPGRVVSVGARFGFVADAEGREFYFTTDRLRPGLRLWPGDRVMFLPLLRTAATASAGNRPLATMLELESQRG